MKKYFNQFNKRLQQLGLTLRDVDADGNCLFRAIADQLTGNEENYNKYRSMAIRSLQKNRKFFSDFLPEGSTFNEYTKRMSEDGIWGGHLELQALSNTLQIDIVVHTLDNYYIIKHMPIKTCWSSFKEKIHLYFNKKQVPTQKQIHIAFHSGKKIINHYQSVRLIDDIQIANDNQLKNKYLNSNIAKKIPLQFTQYKQIPVKNQKYEIQNQLYFSGSQATLVQSLLFLKFSYLEPLY